MLLKNNQLFYKFQQLLIFIIHILLLYWILHLLSHAGELDTKAVILHFSGIGLYGALLIRGTAYWAKWHHLKSQTETTVAKNKNVTR